MHRHLLSSLTQLWLLPPDPCADYSEDAVTPLQPLVGAARPCPDCWSCRLSRICHLLISFLCIIEAPDYNQAPKRSSSIIRAQQTCSSFGGAVGLLVAARRRFLSGPPRVLPAAAATAPPVPLPIRLILHAEEEGNAQLLTTL